VHAVLVVLAEVGDAAGQRAAWPILTVTTSSRARGVFGASAFFGSSLPQP
jgi:hypothetical protein